MVTESVDRPFRGGLLSVSRAKAMVQECMVGQRFQTKQHSRFAKAVGYVQAENIVFTCDVKTFFEESYYYNQAAYNSRRKRGIDYLAFPDKYNTQKKYESPHARHSSISVLTKRTGKEVKAMFD